MKMTKEMENSIKKAIAVYAVESVHLKEEEVTDQMLLAVAKKFIQEKGYLPESWRIYMERKVSK